MGSCASCKSFIIFGGEKVDDYRFCNNKCLEDGQIYIVASKVSNAEVELLSNEIHRGICPKCEKNTGVEVHKSYDIASFIFYTRYQTLRHVCCRVCALKKQSLDLVGSLFLGWWGIPWGILITPVQLVRNIFAMIFPPKTNAPSEELKEAVRMMIAQNDLDGG